MIVGKMMFAGGLAGVICCMVALLVLPRIFEKQRKKLLEKLEEESSDSAGSGIDCVLHERDDGAGKCGRSYCIVQCSVCRRNSTQQV